MTLTKLDFSVAGGVTTTDVVTFDNYQTGISLWDLLNSHGVFYVLATTGSSPIVWKLYTLDPDDGDLTLIDAINVDYVKRLFKNPADDTVWVAFDNDNDSSHLADSVAKIDLSNAESFEAITAVVGGSEMETRPAASSCETSFFRHVPVSRRLRMVFDEVFEPFIDESPVSVMFRGTLETAFSAERLDEIFENVAERQVCGELAFSTCADLLSLVVTRIQPSVNAAYRKKGQDIGVSVKSVYNKLAGIEPAVSESLIRETAADLKPTIDALGGTLSGPLTGYDVRIVDGNHLSGTQHRLKELRTIGDAPLPGHTVAVLNPHTELVEDILVCRDGHANQKPLYLQLLDKVQRGQCWIADRDYSTLDFMTGITERKAYFVIRHHGGLKGEGVGRRRRVGRIGTGIVYEQDWRFTTAAGEELVVRRVTLKLDTPTRDRETELHLLTNLPKKVGEEDRYGLCVALAN